MTITIRDIHKLAEIIEKEESRLERNQGIGKIRVDDDQFFSARSWYVSKSYWILAPSVWHAKRVIRRYYKLQELEWRKKYKLYVPNYPPNYPRGKAKLINVHQSAS